jgi:hypothetical protein
MPETAIPSIAAAPPDMPPRGLDPARRDPLPWSAGVWRRLQEAVRAEAGRIGVSRRVLPVETASAEALTVAENAIRREERGFAIAEAPVTPLNEIWGDFSLTPQQVEGEADLATAVVLGKHVANLLTQAQDALLFQGQAAISRDPVFGEGRIQARSGPAGPGLLDRAPADQILTVEPGDEETAVYGDRTFEAVARGYRLLQAQGHDGPYGLILAPEPYADAFAPLPGTQLMPAERMSRLLGAPPIGSGTLAPGTGVLVSLGGGTLELVIARDARVAFLQEEPDGRFRFRVLERFALRVQDPTAIVKLVFEAAIPS